MTDWGHIIQCIRQQVPLKHVNIFLMNDEGKESSRAHLEFICVGQTLHSSLKCLRLVSASLMRILDLTKNTNLRVHQDQHHLC